MNPNETRTIHRTHDLVTLPPHLGRIYYGKVVKNVDTLDSSPFSRIQCRIVEIHGESTIPDDMLPWFALLKPLFRGNDGKSGWACIPLVGATVAVMFDGGSTDSGIVMGELNTGKSRSVLDTGDPNRWGFADENGTQVLVDTKAKTLHMQHQGVTYDIDQAGNVTRVIPGNYTETVKGNKTVEVDGNLQETIKGSSEQDTTGTNTIKAAQHEVQGPVHATDTITDDADVVASNVSLVHHLTTAVQSGSSDSGPPAPG